MSESVVNLMLGDCLERMKEIPDGSVDMILCDLPYGTTIAQLSAFLATLPQDATVEVLEERDGSWTMYTTWNELDLVDYSDNMKFTSYTNTLSLGNN